MLHDKKIYWLGSGVAIVILILFIVYYTAFEQDAEDAGLVPISVESRQREEGVVIYISGAVEVPGVYSLPTGSRIVDATKVAGGLLPYADADGINLAAGVKDGEHIVIPFLFTPPDEMSGIHYVNINTADLSDLEKLPGVGKATAQKILDYRASHGLFGSIDDIKKIDGIGEGKFLNIRRYLTV